MANLNAINVNYSDLHSGLALSIDDNGGVFTSAVFVGISNTVAGVSAPPNITWDNAALQTANVEYDANMRIEATDGTTTWTYPIVVVGSPIMRFYSAVNFGQTVGGQFDFDDTFNAQNNGALTFNHLATDEWMMAAHGAVRHIVFEMIEAANGTLTMTNSANHRSITVSFDASGIARITTQTYSYFIASTAGFDSLPPGTNVHLDIQNLSNGGILNIVSMGFAGTLEIEVISAASDHWDYTLSLEMEALVKDLTGFDTGAARVGFCPSDSDSTINETGIQAVTWGYTPSGDDEDLDAIVVLNEGGMSFAGASYDRYNDFRIQFPNGPYANAPINTAMRPRKSSSPNVFGRLNISELMWEPAAQFHLRNLPIQYKIQNITWPMTIDFVDSPLLISFYDNNTKTWHTSRNGAASIYHFNLDPVGTAGQIFPANNPTLNLALNAGSGSYFAGMNITWWVIHPMPGQLSHFFATETWTIDSGGGPVAMTMERLDQSAATDADFNFSPGHYGLVFPEGVAGWTLAGTTNLTINSNTTSLNSASESTYTFDIVTTV